MVSPNAFAARTVSASERLSKSSLGVRFGRVVGPDGVVRIPPSLGSANRPSTGPVRSAQSAIAGEPGGGAPTRADISPRATEISCRSTVW